MFDEFLGVPAHPLAIHAPLVLIPIAAVVAVVFVVRSDWRRRIGWIAPAVVLVFVAMLFVAKETGQAAVDDDNVFGDVDRHRELADTTFMMSIVWLVLAVGLTAWDRWGGIDRARALSADIVVPPGDRIAAVLSVLAAIAAIVTTIWLLRTGHAGSESRWTFA